SAAARGCARDAKQTKPATAAAAQVSPRSSAASRDRRVDTIVSHAAQSAATVPSGLTAAANTNTAASSFAATPPSSGQSGISAASSPGSGVRIHEKYRSAPRKQWALIAK